MAAYAHSANSNGIRQPLDDHLRAVAHLAATFCHHLNAEDIGRLVGLWHDLGKIGPEFQRYLSAAEALANKQHGPDHKGVGALLAAEHLPLAALVIQGHHGGLQSLANVQGWLAARRNDPATQAALDEARRHYPDLTSSVAPTIPDHIRNDARAAELFLRLLFSALVDADSLDTEGHFDRSAAARRGGYPSLTMLWERMWRVQERLCREATPTFVNTVREEVYRACLQAAEQPPGLFRLTVPTGGGKTLSGVAFALQHALRHGMRRVIVAVPFISITQQTAEEYRKVFGEETVLEHHSFVEDAVSDGEEETTWADLAAENWDAPIVVTTTVQLFQSLFSNRRRACRKLHRLARSVIVLDEAQALPTHLLDPIVDMLKELCLHYGTSVVLSTATQPAFDSLPPVASLSATDIFPSPVRFFLALKRAEFVWRNDRPLAWEDVAEEMRSERQALAILNTKRDAVALVKALRDSHAFHLSTMLCGAHRTRVIDEVKRRLKENKPCRLVSTQVVEAGVDIDFPLVLRALGPLDSIIQAAGRCNREGHLEKGRVVVFEPAAGSELPRGAYRTGVNLTRALAASGMLDPNEPDAARHYFEQLYDSVETDREHIQELRAHLEYPEVARRFRMIDDDTEDVVVSYGTESEKEAIRKNIEQLQDRSASPRLLLRKLRPYMVSLRRREAERHATQGLIGPILPGVGEWRGDYDPVLGLTGDARSDPDSLVF